MPFGFVEFRKDANRPPRSRAVTALILGMLVLIVGCEPGPPPTPTLPPALDFTVTPTWQSPTPSVTPIPSLTASQTPVPITVTPTFESISTPIPSTETLVPALVASRPPTIPPPVVMSPFATQQPATTPVGANSTGMMNVQTGGVSINPLPVEPLSPDALLDTPANIGFEGGYVEQGAVEVIVPQGWTAWWRTGAIDCGIYEALQTTGPCPAIEFPAMQYKRPEFSVIPADGRWLDPPRVVGEGQGARYFCTYGICDGGYLQQVRVTSGATYALTAQAHAWCTENTGDLYHSQLGTRDEQLNCALALGIDPTGGIDPFASHVIWQAANIYDVFAPLSTGPVLARGDVVTLFLRGRALWPVRHNDFHFDAVSFTRQ